MKSISRSLVPPLLASGLLAAATPAASQDTTPDTDAGDARNFYGEVTPDEFAELDAARQPIEADTFDAGLLAAAIFHRTNAVRAEHDLPSLTHQSAVATAAQQHAERMASGDFLSHGTPNQETNLTPYDRLRNQGLQPQFSAENIAFSFRLNYESGKPFHMRRQAGETVYSYTPGGEPLQPHSYISFAEDVVKQWMNSPHHRENLLSAGPTHLGTGCALSRAENGFDQIYCVQDFYKPLPREEAD